MTKNFSTPTRTQMPYIPYPNSLGLETTDELADDCLGTIAFLRQSLGPGSFLEFLGLERGQQKDTLLGQLSGHIRTLVIAATQHPALNLSQQLLHGLQVMQVGESKFYPNDDARPADAKITIESFLGRLTQF